jgi:DNA-directed RNA polymerase specialized sigma24 family protein
MPPVSETSSGLTPARRLPACGMRGDDRTAAGQFPNTSWTIVQRARSDEPTAEARRALEDICGGYWLPIYAFIRRTGVRPAEAEELTQEFLMRMVEGEFLASADRERGKLRTFLLACVKHFLSGHRRAANRLKRGGGQAPVSIDQAIAEHGYAAEPADDLTPDALFERRWAKSLMNQVMESLAIRMEREGKKELYDALLPFTHLDAKPASIAEAAGKLGMNEAAVKMAISRLRQRLRDRLRETVAETLGPDDDLEEEMLHLRSLLAAG